MLPSRIPNQPRCGLCAPFGSPRALLSLKFSLQVGAARIFFGILSFLLWRRRRHSCAIFVQGSVNDCGAGLVLGNRLRWWLCWAVICLCCRRFWDCWQSPHRKRAPGRQQKQDQGNNKKYLPRGISDGDASLYPHHQCFSGGGSRGCGVGIAVSRVEPPLLLSLPLLLPSCEPAGRGGPAQLRLQLTQVC